CHDYRYLSVYLYLFYPSDSFSSRPAEALYSENLRRFMADPHAAVLSAQYNVYLSTPSCGRDPVYSRGDPQNMFQCLDCRLRDYSGCADNFTYSFCQCTGTEFLSGGSP